MLEINKNASIEVLNVQYKILSKRLANLPENNYTMIRKAIEQQLQLLEYLINKK
jgi:hypothetical protein